MFYDQLNILTFICRHKSPKNFAGYLNLQFLAPTGAQGEAMLCVRQAQSSNNEF